MPSSISTEVLLTPIVIAATTLALMMWYSNTRGGAREPATLSYKPDTASSLSMTLARYVGGHPQLGQPLATPFGLLTERELVLYARRGGPLLFQMPWPKIDQITVLDRPQMEAAAVAVRGLAAGAVEAASPEARFLRVRFEDERGWWQNVVFELAPPHADEQAREVMAFWERHREQPAEA